MQPEQMVAIVVSAAGVGAGGSAGPPPQGLAPIHHFMYGGLVIACGAAGLFFLRFWRKTRDRLFAILAIAFWVLGLHWLVLARTPGMDEVHAVLYTIRLLAFLLILFAIVDKNRSAKASGLKSPS